MALSEDTVARTKNILGMDQLKNRFDHLEPKDIERKIKESSLADLVIMVGQIAQLPPVFGDILTGVVSGRDMIRGVTSDAKILSTTDRAISALFAVLGITVVGGSVAKLAKSKKFAELLQSFSAIAKRLPEKLREFTQK